MKKKLFILSVLICSSLFANETFFNEKNKNVRLDDTVISSTGFEGTNRNNLKNTIIISAEEMEKANYKNVEDVLKDNPSVSFINGNIDLRGMGSDKSRYNTKLLIDGVPVNELDVHNSLQINMVPIEDIERIEIIPGAGTVVYGNNASGGVINIITKKTNMINKTTTTIGSEGGSHGSQKTFAYVTASDGKISAKLYVNDEKNDGYRDYAKNNDKTVSATLRYDLDKDHNIIVKHSNYNSEKNSVSLLKKDELVDRTKSELDGKTKINREETIITYNNKFFNKLDFNLIYQEMENDKLYEGNSHGRKSETDFDSKKKSIKPKFRYEYGKDNNLIFGYDYEDHNTIRDASSFYDFNKESNSIFILNKNRFNNFELMAGFRHEAADYTAKKTSNRTKAVAYDVIKDTSNQAYEFGLNYLYSDTGNFYMRYEKTFLSPTPNQLVEKLLSGDYVANPKLESEISDSYEIGVKDYFLGSYVTASVYYSKTKDEIDFKSVKKTTGWGFASYEYYNIGQTLRKGIEITSEQRTENFVFMQGINYVDAEINSGENKGKVIPGVSKIKATLGVNYKYNEKLDFKADLTYKSDYYIDDANKYGKHNGRTLVDLTVNYRVNPGFKVYGGINNLLAEEYYNSVGLGMNYRTRESYLLYDPAAERTFYLGATYQF